MVADDLTGALDATVPFLPGPVAVLPSGLTAGVRGTDLDERLEVAQGLKVRVLGIDTASRHLPPQRAADRVRAVVSWALSRPERPQIIKKIDSALHGNVLAELQAVVAACDYPGVVLCPALPAQGRVTVGGLHYDVGPGKHVVGRVLSPEDAATDLRRFVPSGYRVVSIDARCVRAAELTDSLRAATGRRSLALVDAASDEDLAVLAASLRDVPSVLLVGSSGLARAVARLRDSSGGQNLGPVAGPQLVVTASRHAAVRGQLHKLAAERDDVCVIELDVAGLEADKADDQTSAMVLRARKVLVSGGVAVLTVPLVALTDERRAVPHQATSVAINSALAALTARVLDSGVQPSRLFLLGGDVAAAVCRRLDVDILVPTGEASPGTVICTGITRASRSTPLPSILMRSGGFGDENDLLTLIGTKALSSRVACVD